jgi:hypothetical protein
MDSSNGHGKAGTPGPPYGMREGSLSTGELVMGPFRQEQITNYQKV